MSATNSTTNYNLPVFVGTDKPAWLTDWNGAMNTIDSAINSVSTAQQGDATAISTLNSSVQALDDTVSGHTTAITSLNNQVSGNTGSINTINSLIGNGEPTTTDKTIIGAINELNAKAIDANHVGYDNTNSGLSATNVQNAIDELSNVQLPTWSRSGDLQYRKMGNTIEVRSYKDNVADATVLGTLPEGYRPTDDILTANGINSGTSRIMIEASTGLVTFQSSGNSNCRYHEMYFG